MNVTGSALYETSGTGYRNKHSNNADAFRNNRLRLDADGKLVCIVSGDAGYSLGIRPKSASAARPGDDLLLSFGLRTCGSSGALSFIGPEGTAVKAHKTLDESDYLAVYDKKLLWRANLYIAEAGGRDWNDVHPWNAPPDATTATAWYTTRTMPAWWSAEWGYNEWNRTWDTASATVTVNGSTVTVNDAFSISSLPAGDGKQVISYDAYTPIKPRNITTRGFNAISDRVSYSYPYEYTDGHFDSPFDFKKKMIIERENTKAYYTENTEASLPECTTVSGTEFAAIPNETLKDHADITAPQGVWGRYLNRNFSIISGTDTSHKKAFIPGLGLLKYGKDKDAWNASGNFNSNYSEDLITGSFPTISGTSRASANSAEPYPAGTDCVGLVQRAASYSGERYTWGNIANGWAEGGALYLHDITIDIGGRSYPRARLADGSADTNFSETYAVTSHEIFRREGINFDILVESATAHIDKQNELSSVVPGDVFYWRLSSGSMHIALVDKIILGADGRVSDIVLIEATFGNEEGRPHTQYIVNFRSLRLYYLKNERDHYHIVRLSGRSE